MLSRVADNMYWMSRYVERTDGLLRMLKINYASSQDDQRHFSWLPVLKIFTYLPEQEAIDMADKGRKVLQYMVTDRDNPNSVLNIVTLARENARSVQDHITKELWQSLNDFYHAVRDERLQYALEKEDPITIIDEIVKKALLFYGTADITMARGEGYSFMNMGRYVERAVQSADILDVKFADSQYDFTDAADTTYWKYLLLSISGYELYIKTNATGFEASRVVEQIVLNTQFPRSIIYSLNQLQRYFERLEPHSSAEAFSKTGFLLGKIKNQIYYSTVAEIMEQGLHDFLMRTKNDLYQFGLALNRGYFAHS
jgi:uncharacterized alpha-E superfamily protein